ncbi:MAG: phosphatidate cytidylyltransferase [Bauldia sp.]|nr:phosphatidate cytidylyltransferase [Bauldia sp.]
MAELVASWPAPLLYCLGALWLGLVAATIAVAVIARRGASSGAELVARTQTWWWIVVPVTAALLLGATATAILFAVVSFLALREYLSIIPVRQVDRTAILLAYLTVPLQYWFVHDDWYGMFVIFIPVYAAAAIAFRLVLAGEVKGFIRSAGTLQWGLFLTVYNLSHVAFLMQLDMAAPLPAGGAGQLLFLLVVVQLNDVAQFVWGKLFGRHPIAPHVSPKKTVEGFAGGVVTSMAVAALLSPWLTPFGPVEAAVVGAGLAFLGFVGDVTVSAVKRDLGIKDAGAILPGHGGILDRLDSLVFAAPIFLHYVRYYYGA